MGMYGNRGKGVQCVLENPSPSGHLTSQGDQRLDGSEDLDSRLHPGEGGSLMYQTVRASRLGGSLATGLLKEGIDGSLSQNRQQGGRVEGSGVLTNQYHNKNPPYPQKLDSVKRPEGRGEEERTILSGEQKEGRIGAEVKKKKGQDR